MMARRLFLVAVALALVSLVLPVHAATIFFDDFTSSQLSTNWQVQQQGTNTPYETGGYLFFPAIRTLCAISFGCQLNFMNNFTQSSSGMIGANTVDGQFYQLTVKLQPFNYSETTNSVVTKNAELLIGLENANNSRGFGVMMEESDITAGNGNALLGRRSVVALYFVRPMNGATHCFASQGVEVALAAQSCGTLNPAMIYEPNIGQFDLNSGHVLTFQMKLFPVAHTSWIAFQIDTNGWYNVTQTACQCIDAASGTYYEMNPYVHIDYCGGNTGGGISCSTTTADQSVSSAIDYMLVTDTPVAVQNLPVGQILSSNVHPPTQNAPLGVNTFSLPQFLQFEANSIAPGNIYAGGMLLTGLFCTLAFPFFVLVGRKAGIGVRGFGFFYSIMVLGISFLGLFVGILPIWVPVMTTIIAMAIVFGIIRTGPAEGGVVPD